MSRAMPTATRSPLPELAYTLSGAQHLTPPTCLVLDSPHSWRAWPADDGPIAAPPEALETSWDAWVDELWTEALDGRAPLLAARFHRAWIDANRARDDIDPALLSEPWPEPIHPGEKSQRGFGLLRRDVLPGVPLYGARRLGVAEVQRRLADCYDPYHARLAGLIDAAHARHGRSLHINCHSMKTVGNAMNDDAGEPRPDFVVSDLGGTTADPALTRWVADRLAALGHEVKVNDPYLGAELIRRHAAPARGRHSLQIEIKRSLYMDETRVQRHAGYARLVGDLRTLVDQLLPALARGLPGRSSPPG